MLNKNLLLVLGGLALLTTSIYIVSNQKLQSANNLRPSKHSNDLKGYYQVSQIQKQNSTNWQIHVDYNGPETSYLLNKNELIRNILVEIQINGKTELNIKFTDKNKHRFEVPYNKFFPHNKVFDFPEDNDFIVEVSNPQFALVVKRKSTQEIILDTRNSLFVYSDLLHEITFQQQGGEYIYGLGERRQQFVFQSGNYTFWNKDQYMMFDEGNPDHQTYGTHPMYLKRELSGNFHVVFLRNYNAIQVSYERNKALRFKVVGGLLEFKVFLGNEYPDNVLKQYHEYINGFSLHPFWSQGFHQCRWGYTTSALMVEVWEKFMENDLPLDIIWSDIDYMNELVDFTIDRNRYNSSEMNRMLNRENDQGIHWVPIIDAGVAIADVSNARGKEMDIFQKSNKTGQDLIGCVWPGKVNFPDFNHPKTEQYWVEGLKNITKNYDVQPSGFWIDMNEFSNFINGELDENDVCIMPNDPNAPKDEKYLGIRQDDFYTELPFQVGGSDEHNLQEKTMSMDAPKYNKEDAQYIHNKYGDLREFDFHNLNGFTEGIATNKALKEMGNKLPFIISRSQIAGSGQFVQHWTGDNGSQWKFLQSSLAEIFNFNLFAIPMVGADICGFAQNTTAELCARWMQVGAFYPFSRNHNANDTISQEPYAFGNEGSYVLETSRKNLKIRYALLKHYYAQFVLAEGKGSIFKPLFFEFPEDETIYENDQQFMIGRSLMGIPVLEQSENPEQQYTDITGYFPKGSAFYGFSFNKQQRFTHSEIKLRVPFDGVMPLFIREGHIVFSQFENNQNRARLLNNRFEVHVALKKVKEHYVAKGRFITLSDYSDDKLIDNCINGNCAFKIKFIGSVQGDSLQLNVQIKGQNENTHFEQIFIDKFIFYAEDLQWAEGPVLEQTLEINGNKESVITLNLQ